MKIQVSVKPNSRKESIEKNEEGVYIVRVNAPPIEGKANKRVIEMLAKKFGVSKSKVTLLSGQKSKLKLFKIDND